MKGIKLVGLLLMITALFNVHGMFVNTAEYKIAVSDITPEQYLMWVSMNPQIYGNQLSGMVGRIRLANYKPIYENLYFKLIAHVRMLVSRQMGPKQFVKNLSDMTGLLYDQLLAYEISGRIPKKG